MLTKDFMEDTSHRDAVRVPQDEKNKKKSTFLIVEDRKDLFHGQYQEAIADNKNLNDTCEIVWASTLSEAISVLCDPKRTIAGAIIDNGFPVLPGSARKGAKDSGGIALVQFMRNESIEQLVRFIKLSSDEENVIPTTPARTTEYDALIQNLQSVPYERRGVLKDVPVVWTSVMPDAGKVTGLFRAAGISDEDVEIIKSKLVGGHLYKDLLKINNCTACCGKENIGDAFTFITDCISLKRSAGSAPSNPGRQ